MTIMQGADDGIAPALHPHRPLQHPDHQHRPIVLYPPPFDSGSSDEEEDSADDHRDPKVNFELPNQQNDQDCDSFEQNSGKRKTSKEPKMLLSAQLKSNFETLKTKRRKLDVDGTLNDSRSESHETQVTDSTISVTTEHRQLALETAKLVAAEIAQMERAVAELENLLEHPEDGLHPEAAAPFPALPRVVLVASSDHEDIDEADDAVEPRGRSEEGPEEVPTLTDLST